MAAGKPIGLDNRIFEASKERAEPHQLLSAADCVLHLHFSIPSIPAVANPGAFFVVRLRKVLAGKLE